MDNLQGFIAEFREDPQNDMLYSEIEEIEKRRVERQCLQRHCWEGSDEQDCVCRKGGRVEDRIYSYFRKVAENTCLKS